MSSPEALDAFERYVATAESLRWLLTAAHSDNEEMLKLMREDTNSRPPGTAEGSGT